MLDRALDQLPAANAGNGAARYQMVVAFVKGVDPGSVAREGEVDLARKIQSLQGKLESYADLIAEGKSPIIPDELIRNMNSTMRESAKWYEDKIRGYRDNYTKRAKRWQVDDSVFTDAPNKYQGPKLGDRFSKFEGED